MNRIPCLLAFAAAAIGLASGCSGPSAPDASDPEVGRALLKQTLEAWKRGESIDVYRQTATDVEVLDRAWRKGAGLVEFEIQSDSVAAGYDVQFKVALTVQDSGSASPKKQKALFNVSTRPRLVVSRAEGGW